MLEIICVVSFVSVCLCLSSIKFLKDYERLVIFRLGRLAEVRGPGPQIVWPFIETYKKLDLRITALPIIAQEIMTKDKLPVAVSAVCYYQIADPKKTILHIDNYREATGSAVQSVFKDVLKSYHSDELSTINRKVLKALKVAIEPTVATWGVRITEFTISINEKTATVALSPSALDESKAGSVGSDTSALTATDSKAVGLEGSAANQLSLPSFEVAARESVDDEHHHKRDLAHHRKHKHAPYSFGHDSYDFGHQSYEYGHEKKPE